MGPKRGVGMTGIAVFVEAVVAVHLAPPVVAIVVRCQRLPPLLRRRAVGAMIFSYAFLVGALLAFLFLLLLLPLFPGLV